jgi:hypothetical protein
MKKTALILIALAVLTGSAFAGTYRVTYTFRGLETRTTVQAESIKQAQHIVEAMFPDRITRRDPLTPVLRQSRQVGRPKESKA